MTRTSTTPRAPRAGVVVLIIVAIGMAAGATRSASAAAPTAEEVRRSYEAGHYQPTLRMIAQCLALKGDAAAGYDRYELLTLRGECLIRLKSLPYAADAFEDAKVAAGQDVGRRTAAEATELLFRGASELKYVPRSGAAKSPVDVVDPDSRRQAMTAMRDDVMTALGPKIDRALKAGQLTPALEILPKLREAAVLEYAASGGIENLRPVLTALGTHARKLIIRELDVKQAAVEQINTVANDVVFTAGFGARRGLYTEDRKDLAATADYLRKIEAVAREGRRISHLLDGDAAAWDAILSDADAQLIRIDSVLNRPT